MQFKILENCQIIQKYWFEKKYTDIHAIRNAESQWVIYQKFTHIRHTYNKYYLMFSFRLCGCLKDMIHKKRYFLVCKSMWRFEDEAERSPDCIFHTCEDVVHWNAQNNTVLS